MHKKTSRLTHSAPLPPVKLHRLKFLHLTPNSTTSWGSSAETHTLVGDISHSDHTTQVQGDVSLPSESTTMFSISILYSKQTFRECVLASFTST